MPRYPQLRIPVAHTKICFSRTVTNRVKLLKYLSRAGSHEQRKRKAQT